MKKILFFIEGISGGGQQTFNYHFMKHIDREKFSLSTCYFLDGSMRPQFESVSDELIQLNKPPVNWIRATRNIPHILRMSWHLRNLIKSKKYDMVVSNAPYTYFIACIGCWFSSVRHVRMMGKEPSKEKLLWRVFRLFPFINLTDIFLSFSYANKEFTLRGVPEYKLLDVLNAVDTKLFSPTLSAEEKKLGRQLYNIPNDCLVVGWTGRIEANMEVNNTVDMLAELINLGFKDFRFLCVGDGSWMKEFQAKVRKRGLEPYTIYTGWQPMDKVQELLQYMDIMPLLDKDPIGGSIVREAMSMGVAVLSVDGKSGFQAEWVKNDINGMMVKPENYAIEAAKVCIDLYNDPAKRKRLSKAGRDYAVNTLDFKTKVRIFEEACDQLFNNQKTPKLN